LFRRNKINNSLLISKFEDVRDAKRSNSNNLRNRNFLHDYKAFKYACSEDLKAIILKNPTELSPNREKAFVEVFSNLLCILGVQALGYARLQEESVLVRWIDNIAHSLSVSGWVPENASKKALAADCLATQRIVDSGEFYKCSSNRLVENYDRYKVSWLEQFGEIPRSSPGINLDTSKEFLLHHSESKDSFIFMRWNWSKSRWHEIQLFLFMTEEFVAMACTLLELEPIRHIIQYAHKGLPKDCRSNNYQFKNGNTSFLQGDLNLHSLEGSHLTIKGLATDKNKDNICYNTGYKMFPVQIYSTASDTTH